MVMATLLLELKSSDREAILHEEYVYTCGGRLLKVGPFGL